jgi:hypothetical protein
VESCAFEAILFGQAGRWPSAVQHIRLTNNEIEAAEATLKTEGETANESFSATEFEHCLKGIKSGD